LTVILIPSSLALKRVIHCSPWKDLEQAIMLSMKPAAILILCAVAAQAQMQRAKFATGYMYSYYVPQSASTPWRPAWSPDGREIAFGMSGSLWKITGCPIAALAPELSRMDSKTKKRVGEVLRDHRAGLLCLLPGERPADRERAFSIIIPAMLGAVQIARGVVDREPGSSCGRALTERVSENHRTSLLSREGDFSVLR
jgi:hypothetical protein